MVRISKYECEICSMQFGNRDEAIRHENSPYSNQTLRLIHDKYGGASVYKFKRIENMWGIPIGESIGFVLFEEDGYGYEAGQHTKGYRALHLLENYRFENEFIDLGEHLILSHGTPANKAIEISEDEFEKIKKIPRLEEILNSRGVSIDKLVRGQIAKNQPDGVKNEKNEYRWHN